MDYKRFQDIPQYFRANWRCNFSWRHLAETFKSWNDKFTYIERTPNFQRPHVWTEAQQIAYVEYRLRGGPSAGELQWNCKVWDDFKNKEPEPIELVDGLQRLTAVEKFMAGELKVFDKYLNEYEDRPYRGEFVFFVNNLKTRKEVLEWYLQLNDGGVVHTKDELDKVRRLLLEEQVSNGLR